MPSSMPSPARRIGTTIGLGWARYTPVVGPTKVDGLWLNTGHGTLGWTMACGSGRYLADLMSARQPQISTEGLDIFRYGQYGHAPQHENRTCVLPAR